MGNLFDSYINPTNPAQIFCDLSQICESPEANTRLLCGEINVFCGSNEDCSRTIVNNGLILCECSDTWNNDLCGNDLPFCYQFRDGDVYTFQFQQPNISSATDGWASDGTLISTDPFAYFEIYKCCDDELILVDQTLFDEIVLNQFVGSFELPNFSGVLFENQIQQIQFDLGAIADYLISLGDEPCFYFKFCFSKTSSPIPYPINYDNVDCFCSENFRLENCVEKNQSVLISSIYTSTDCFGQYYGNNWGPASNGTPFVFSNQIRVPCSFEMNNFTITKNIIESSRKTTGSELCESWMLKTYPLPLRFARLLASISAGADVYINNREYQFQGELSKNNDIGSRWWAEMQFEHCECSKNLTC
jgi:hypothetical protein